MDGEAGAGRPCAYCGGHTHVCVCCTRALQTHVYVIDVDMALSCSAYGALAHGYRVQDVLSLAPLAARLQHQVRLDVRVARRRELLAPLPLRPVVPCI